MRVIKKTTVKDAMLKYPQWQLGMEIWIAAFDKRDLQLNSFSEIKEKWKSMSGWNTDRISGKRLKNEHYSVVFDLYIFDIHGTSCRLLAKIQGNNIFVRDILSHAEYTEWCKRNVHQGKLKRV